MVAMVADSEAVIYNQLHNLATSSQRLIDYGYMDDDVTT